VSPGRGLTAAVGFLVLVVGCAGPGATSSTETTGDRPRVTKTITIGIQREPETLGTTGLTATGGTSGGQNHPGPIFHDGLTARVGVAGWEARLATEMPSVERGTWRLNPDGTMDVGWTLRPNIRWHDGTPLTTDDLVWSFRLRQEFPTRTSGGGRPELMESLSAVDAQTFVVRWKQVYVGAPETGVTILPRHILEPQYTGDQEAFLASRYFRTEFVGVGAYRLTAWEQGSHIEGQAFDGYYLGRPSVDRIVVRIVADPNALLANALGDAIDVVLSDGVDNTTALEVKSRWEAGGNRIEFFEIGGLNQLELQHRAEFAKPATGLPVRAVRQALYHALDRATLNEVMNGSVAPVADSWIAPSHPLRRDLEASIPQFPFDPARAQSLLAQSGWTPGADGVLTRDGEAFETSVMGERGTGGERALSVVADNWRRVGVLAPIEILTTANQNDREYQSKRGGVYLTSPSGVNFYDNRLHSNAITRADNRWSGTNRGGYNNPRVDATLEKLQVTVDARERVPLHRELLQEQMTDIALMPLSWEVVPVLIRGGVTGVTVDANNGTEHIHKWKRP
jgi:peptide/nickel transport system substrate-binding protein